MTFDANRSQLLVLTPLMGVGRSGHDIRSYRSEFTGLPDIRALCSGEVRKRRARRVVSEITSAGV